MSRLDTAGILASVPLETTIKVDRALRDRINAAAREQRMTPAGLVAILLDGYERQRWVALAVAEMNAGPADEEEPPYPMPEGLIPFVHEPDGAPDPDPYPTPRWIAELERGEAERP